MAAPDTNCQSFAFAIEVAGINNPEPDSLPVIMGKAPDAQSPKVWKKENFQHHTVYLTDFTTYEAWADKWALFLEVPGLNKPLPITSISLEKKDNEDRLFPTGYCKNPTEYLKYIFIPFRPLTCIIDHGGLIYTDGSGTQETQTVDLLSSAPNIMKEHKALRTLRPGYLYIFKDGKLWREILVQKNDSNVFTDIYLDEARELWNSLGEEGPTDEQLETLDKRKPQKQWETGEEIWVPVELRKEQVGLQIAYSEKQWSWAYIAWLEEKKGGQRFQNLGQMADLYKREAADRFSELRSMLGNSKDVQRFCPNKRASLQMEALGLRNILSTALSGQFGLNPALQGLSLDSLILKAIYKFAYIPPCYDEAELMSKLEEGAKPGGPGVDNYRGAFLVFDYLYTPMFYAFRAMFYLHILQGLDMWLKDIPLGFHIWKILKNKANGDMSEFEKELKSGCLRELETQYIQPVVRETVIKILADTVHSLAASCFLDHAHLSDFQWLPGARDCSSLGTGVAGALQDLFTLNGDDYIAGWSWVKMVAGALKIDPYNSSICVTGLKPSKTGALTGSQFHRIEDLSINGTPLWKMLYPDPTKKDYNITTELPGDYISGIERNKGDGLCRYNYLRTLYDKFGGDDDKADWLFTVAGVGQLFYEHHLQRLIGTAEGGNLSPVEGLKHSANLLRLLPDFSKMVIAAPEELDKFGYKILSVGMKLGGAGGSSPLHLPGANGGDDKVFSRTVTGRGSYLYREMGPNIYAARNEKSFAKKIPASTPCLLVMPSKATDQLQIWVSLMQAVADGGTSIDLPSPSATARLKSLGIFYLVVASYNLMVSAESVHSKPAGGLNELRQCLNTAGAMVNFSQGIFSSKDLYNRIKAGIKMKDVHPSSTCASKGFAWLSRAATVIGVSINTLDAVMAYQRGDRAAAACFGFGAAMMLAGLWAGPFAPVVGVMGFGLAVTGSFLLSEELAVGLRQSCYGKESLSHSDNENELLKFLKYSSPVRSIVESFDIKEFAWSTRPRSEYADHACYIKSACTHVMDVHWPLFAFPTHLGQFDSRNVCANGKILILEDEKRALIFSDGTWQGQGTDQYATFTLKHNNEPFADITGSKVSYKN
ncbi:hypothetical protein C4J81_06900 [Deltaproteobacteria bacterium Smac51]|nr:hypothetical protein C4J81_06900 [Deltaproteobacteria bacterium Smac51]